jgi:hypothetical protein
MSTASVRFPPRIARSSTVRTTPATRSDLDRRRIGATHPYPRRDARRDTIQAKAVGDSTRRIDARPDGL